MKRVLVLGPSGSGTSTFSKKLADILQIPCIHMDLHYWKPHWVESTKEEWNEKVKELISRDKWVMDGNYSTSLDMRLDRADTAIFLDIPRWLSLFRILKRRIDYHGRVRPDLPEGCLEKMDFDFFKWVWNYPNRSRPVVLELLTKHKSTTTVYQFASTTQAESFLDSLD
ncbi:MAG: AAA family ATPase [Candidatus Hodarchaeota archaeon]